MAKIPKAEVDITAKDSTQKGIKSAESGMTKLGKSVSSAAKSMAIAFAGTTAAAAAVYAGIHKLTSIYAEQEKSEIKLIAASRNNPFIDGTAVKGLMEAASAFQDISTYGDEALIPLMSMGVNMGLTKDQIEGVTGAAINLASATDMSLDAAFRNLYKTLGGTAGELGETIPAMKELTVEALKNGDAIELISKQYGGMAEAVRSSTSGVRDAFKNMIGDQAEKIGAAFAPLERIILTKLTPIFQEIGNWFEQNSSRITNFFLNFGEIARLTFVHIKMGLEEAFKWDNVVDTFWAFIDFFKKTFINAFKFLLQLTTSIGTTIWLPLKKGFEWVGYGIQVAWQTTIVALARAINWLVENPINAIATAFETVVHSIGEAIQWILNGIIGMINMVITGIDKVVEAAHNARQIIDHPFNASKREVYKSGANLLPEMDIDWLDPKKHEKLTTNLANFVDNLEKIEPPANEWESIWDNIVASWKDTGVSAVEAFKNQTTYISELGDVLAKPFVIGFEGFTQEFIDILDRELPAEARSTVTKMLENMQAAAAVTGSYAMSDSSGGYEDYSSSSFFSTYLKTTALAIGDSLKKAGDVFMDVFKWISYRINSASDFLVLAFTEPREAIAQAGLLFVRSLRMLASKTDEIVSFIGKALLYGLELASKALLYFGNAILSIISSTTSVSDMFSSFSTSMQSLFEGVIVPLVNAAQPLINIFIQLATLLVTALKPFFDALITILEILLPVFKALEPLIIAIADALNALAPILVMFAEFIAQILYPIIKILTQVFEIIANILVKLAPVFEAIFNALLNILLPVLQFISDILQIIAPVLDFIADIFVALAPIIEAIGVLIGSILAPALEFIANLLEAILTPILEILSGVLMVLVPIFEMIGILLKALSPIFKIIFQLLSILLIPLQLLGTILQILTPIFQILSAVLNFLIPIIEFFALAIDAITRPIEFVADLLMFLGQTIKAAMQTIWYLITFQWSKLGDIEWPSFQSDAFTRPLGEYESPTINIQSSDLSSTSDLSGASLSAERSSSGYGSSPSYGGQDLTVNVTINAEAIVGDPGLQEFALMINREIQRATSLGIV